jgi:hypothetical protein
MVILEATAQAQWQRLVQDAARLANLQLDEELEAYLVYLLSRYTREQSLGHQVQAVQYLQQLMENASQRRETLQNVGDHCLLTTGLFPARSRRRRVPVQYYVDLGRTAYDDLSQLVSEAWSGLYQRLADGFIMLMDVLLAMRELDGNSVGKLEPLLAHELCRIGSERGCHSLALQPGTVLTPPDRQH